jgi:two-component system, LytTR family, sensor kinase
MESRPTKNRKLVKWLGIWAVWTLFALFFASQFALQNQLSANPVSFWRILSWQLVSGYIWFAISPVILFLARRFPFDEGRWKTSVPVHLIACLAIALVQLALDAFVLTRLGYPPSREFSNFFEAYKFFVLVNLHLSILIYMGVVGIWSTYSYYQKYRERELHSSQLEARLAQSRLQVLKMQLHPHFLFNTLNAISELIYKDPESADRMLTDLSDLLRLSFENLEVQEIPLQQELEFLEKYLEIEQMRFHDRLSVNMRISPETLDASVPNMILQPLVENAIKHGIAPRSSGGRIDISTTRNNGHLEIEVSDDGLGVPFGDLENLPEGIGLSNTRRRLKHLYGDKHHFGLKKLDHGGLGVTLEIPFRVYEE